MKDGSWEDDEDDEVEEVGSPRKRKRASMDEGRVVACTFVNNLSAFVNRPLCTVPRILLQCYCNCLSNLL